MAIIDDGHAFFDLIFFLTDFVDEKCQNCFPESFNASILDSVWSNFPRQWIPGNNIKLGNDRNKGESLHSTGTSTDNGNTKQDQWINLNTMQTIITQS